MPLRQKQLMMGAATEEHSLAYGDTFNEQREKVLVFAANAVHLALVRVWPEAVAVGPDDEGDSSQTPLRKPCQSCRENDVPGE